MLCLLILSLPSAAREHRSVKPESSIISIASASRNENSHIMKAVLKLRIPLILMKNQTDSGVCLKTASFTMLLVAICLKLNLHAFTEHRFRCGLAQLAQANHVPCDILFHIAVQPIDDLSKALTFVRLNDNPFVILLNGYLAA